MFERGLHGRYTFAVRQRQGYYASHRHCAGAQHHTVNPDVQAKTLKELLDLVKAQPGKLSYATAGIGGTGHVAMELMKSMSGSAPALTDVVGGRVEVSSDNLPAVQPFVEAGKLRALAVTSTKRWPELPDLPTVSEAGVPGYEASAWFTIAAPAKTPREIIEKVNASVNKYMSEPETIARMRKLGAEPVGGSPEDMGKLLADETVKWKKVIDFAGLKADQ
jgi:tripartite-type tricarboxylate transporter receptor subunit TctC